MSVETDWFALYDRVIFARNRAIIEAWPDAKEWYAVEGPAEFIGLDVAADSVDEACLDLRPRFPRHDGRRRDGAPPFLISGGVSPAGSNLSPGRFVTLADGRLLETSWLIECEVGLASAARFSFHGLPDMPADNRAGQLARLKDAPVFWREHVRTWFAEVTKSSGRAPVPTEGAFYLGDGRVVINGDPITLADVEDMVVSALVSMRSADMNQLRDESGVDRAERILLKLVRKHDALAEYIFLPGGRSRGGYRTTIAAFAAG